MGNGTGLCSVFCLCTYGPRHEKTCLRGCEYNTGADQPAHPHSLIRAFVHHFLEGIIYVDLIMVQFSS